MSRELNITAVRVAEYYQGVSSQNWQQIAEILTSYGVDPQKIRDAATTVKNKGSWRQNFRHATLVNTRIFKERDGYSVYLRSNNPQERPERDVASRLGLQRLLKSKQVEVGLATQDNKFFIDFDSVAEIVSPVVNLLEQPIGRQRLMGEEIANVLFQNTGSLDGPDAYLLGTKDGLTVTLGLLAERAQSYPGTGRATDSWKKIGAALSVDRCDPRFVDNTFHPVTILIRKVSRRSQYRSLPILDPRMKETVDLLATKFADAFQNKQKLS